MTQLEFESQKTKAEFLQGYAKAIVAINEAAGIVSDPESRKKLFKVIDKIVNILEKLTE